jgi:hypothetical protein
MFASEARAGGRAVELSLIRFSWKVRTTLCGKHKLALRYGLFSTFFLSNIRISSRMAMNAANTGGQVSAATSSAQQSNDLAPRLGNSPDLLLHLGLCIAVASSRECSRVRLPACAPAYV